MMPLMGRRKFKMENNRLHGRNEIFGTYIKLCFESIMSNADEVNRGRKQVSSHMQVVKNWFKKSRACKSAF